MIHHVAVAWYPEHCDESRWPLDIAQMRSAGIDTVRVLEFVWSRLERADGQWDFGWVHRFMKLLSDAQMNVVACTPSASPPRWLTREHPDCLQVQRDGQPVAPGARRHYCPTSRTYRDFCCRIARKMQEELARYDNVIAWQIDNELGFNRCFCDGCESAFRAKMQARYGTLDRLNDAWGGAFWSTDCWDWQDVTLPRSSPAPEVRQAFDQFYSDSIIEFMEEQIDALRQAGCRAPISTNFMADFPQIDYWRAAKKLDVIGWDNYFDQFTVAGNSLAHHLMRSLKGGAGYWSFENGVNSVSPWLQSAPGFMAVHALSAAAHGEIGHTVFRFDSCPFGHEQDLQGLVDWAGKPRAKLAEVRDFSRVLAKWRSRALPAFAHRVAIIFSWQNYWGTGAYYGRSCESSPYESYWNEIERFYTALFDLGISCDLIDADGPLDGYDLVLTPGLCLASDEQIDNVRAFVKRGGVLLSGRKTFAKLPTGSYRRQSHPAGLTDVFGATVIETQSNEDGNDLKTRSAAQRRPFRQFRLAGVDGVALPASTTDGWFEVLAINGAKPLYAYQDGYFAGGVAATRHGFGAGQAFYLGAAVDRKAMKAFVQEALLAAGIDQFIDVPDGAQIIRRGDTVIALNYTGQPLTIRLPGPAVSWDGEAAVQAETLTLPPFGFAWINLEPRPISEAALMPPAEGGAAMIP